MTAEEGRWDYTEDDKEEQTTYDYDPDELEKARQRMNAEKDVLDKEEDLFTGDTKPLEHQKGGEDAVGNDWKEGDDFKSTKWYDPEDPATQGSRKKEAGSYDYDVRAGEEDEGWGDNWGDPEDTAKDIYDLGHPEKIIPLTSTGMAEEPQDEDNKAEEQVDEENKCENCERAEDFLNDDGLCEDCEREAGIDRKESERDAYEGYWRNSNPFDLTSELEYVEGEPPITPGPKPKDEKDAEEGGVGSGRKRSTYAPEPEQIARSGDPHYDPYKATPQSQRIQTDPALSRMTEEAPDDIDPIFGKEEVTDDSDIALLSQLFNNEMEEQEKGEDETEDIAIISQLIGEEDFKEGEHPRGGDSEHPGRFSAGSGGTSGTTDKPKEKKFTMKQYDRNEDRNDHSKNALLLTRQYGTPEEIKEMEGIVDRHNKSESGINHDDYLRRYEISDKYVKNLQEDSEKPKEPKRKLLTDRSGGAWKIDVPMEPQHRQNLINDVRERINRLQNDKDEKTARKKIDKVEDMSDEQLSKYFMWMGGKPVFTASEVDLNTMNQAHVWWDNKFPDRPWSDMRIGDRQHAILAFLRDPDTEITVESKATEAQKSGYIGCPHCNQEFSNVQYLKDHIDEQHEGKESKATEEQINADTWYHDYSEYWKKGSDYSRAGLALQANIPTDWTGTEWDDLPADIQAKIRDAGYVTSYETYDKMSWEFLPRTLKEKLGEGFTPVNESIWSTSTKEQRREILKEGNAYDDMKYKKDTLDKLEPWSLGERPEQGFDYQKGGEDVSVSGPPANTQPPANMFDDEEDESPAGEGMWLDDDQTVNSPTISDIPDMAKSMARGYYNKLKRSLQETPQWEKDLDDLSEVIAIGEANTEHEPAGSSTGGQFTSKGGGGDNGKSENKLSSTSDKDLIKSIKGGSKDWHEWGRNEKTEDAYAEIERRNKEIPTPKLKGGDKIFRDDPDAVGKMEKKIKYWEEQQDYWKQITKFPNRDYQNRNQLGDARWFMLTSVGTNLREAKKKLEGIKEQQGRGTDLIRKPTYKDGKKRFYYSEEPKGEPTEEPWQKGGESYQYIVDILKKKSSVEQSPNALMRYTEPIDLPNGKNALDQTYGVSEPETPDGQDLTGITIGEEEIIEKKFTPPKILFYKQYPFGRRAGKQNPFGESYAEELDVDASNIRGLLDLFGDMNSYIDSNPSGVTVDELKNKFGSGEEFEFNLDDLINGGYAYREGNLIKSSKPKELYEAKEFESPLRDMSGNPYPTPTGIADCTFCGKVFDNWDVLGDHITIVHNDQGRTREFYGGNAPQSILNHPDWTGYAGEGGQGSGRKQYKSEDPKSKDKAHIGWKNYGIDDYIDKAEQDYLAKEQLEDPTPWISLAHLAGTTVKDILFPEKSDEFWWNKKRRKLTPDELKISKTTFKPKWKREDILKQREREREAKEYNDSHSSTTGQFTSGGGGSKYPEKPEGLTDKEYGKQKKEYDDSQKVRSDRSKTTYAKKKWSSLTPNQRTLFTIRKGYTFDSRKEGDDFTNKNMKGDFDKLDNHLKNSFIDNIDSYRVNEGGFGSGKKDHKGWMRAIEEEHTYDFCENCNMITEQVNHKCDMCGKKVIV